MDDARKAEIEAETKRDIKTAVSNMLVKAVREGRVADFDALVKAWADPNVAVEGRSLLCCVIAGATPLPFDDVVEVARALIAVGADVNVQGPDGLTPLLTALMGDNSDLVSLLLECGADANLHPADKVSPLFLAVEGDLAQTRDTMTRLLIARGAKPDAHLAALEAQGVSTVRQLLKKTAQEKQALSATGIVSLAAFAQHAAHLLSLLPADPRTMRQDALRQRADATGEKYKLPKGPRR